jgi:lipopolysaccharide exporter
MSGLRWTYTQAAVSAVLQLVMAAVLGRLLTPAAFGLVALANLVLRFVDRFARIGVSQAIVQKLDLDDEDVRAAFTISVGFSAMFTAAAWLASPLAADLFNEPGLVPVLRAMSLSLLIVGLGAPSTGLLRRDMRFRTLAIIGIVSYVVGYGIVGVGLAILGGGVTALVGAALTQAGVTTVVAYAIRRHSVRPSRSRAAYRAIIAFGGRVSVIGFFEFLGNELDTLAVGRYANVTQLGLYNRGYLLVSLPLYQLKSGLSKVLFPALSSIQTDLPRLRRTYLSAIGGAAAIGLPICAGIAVAANELILVILGPQWVDAVPVVPWLAVAAAMSLVGHFGGVMAEALNVLNAKLVIVVSKVGFLAVLLWLAAGGPVEGYAAALAGAATYAQFAYVLVMARTLRLPSATILARLAPAVLAAALVVMAQGGVRWLLVLAATPEALSLAAQIGTAAIVLAASLRFGPLRTTAREVVARTGQLAPDGTTGDAGSRRRLTRIIRSILG